MGHSVDAESYCLPCTLTSASKSSGPDNIPARFLREGASEIAPSLTNYLFIWRVYHQRGKMQTLFHYINLGINQTLSPHFIDIHDVQGHRRNSLSALVRLPVH